METGWQEGTLRDLCALLEPKDEVLALAVYGSAAAGGQTDPWSDLDVLVVVRDVVFAVYHPATLWLASLGRVFAAEEHDGEAGRGVTRVCFDDFRRLDVSVATEGALARVETWPSVAFWDRARRQVLFSRSAVADAALLTRDYPPPAPSPPSEAQFADTVSRFWFRAVVALTKAMRGDLLIAAHLTLEAAQDCLVLGMLIRDRRRGTPHHPRGGEDDGGVAARLDAGSFPATAAGVLDHLERCAVAFDELAGQWSPSYTEHRHPFLLWIASARQHLS